MMLSKPAPTASATSSSKNNVATVTKKPATSKNPEQAVADLERRLAILSTATSSSAATNTETAKSAPPAAAPAAAAAQPAAAPIKGGKNALLARIMAAQERAKQAHAPEAGAPDLLGGNDGQQQQEAPPPAFDESLLPPPAAENNSTATSAASAPPPPPAFDDMLLPPPEPTVQPQAPVVPLAPALEDLMFLDEEGPPAHHHAQAPPAMPPPVEAPTKKAPPPAQSNESTVEAILGIEGLSEEERKALLEEQRRIMASIEAEKKSQKTAAADAAADAFEQRSFSRALQAVGGGSVAAAPPARTMATMPPRGNKTRTVHLGSGEEVALHGQERTRQAIAQGTALLVQCVSCSNYMQVTDAATLMFCPVCQVVVPVNRSTAMKAPRNSAAPAASGASPAATGDSLEAQQMAADMELAEQLQKEEYKQAEEAEEMERRRKEREQKAKEAASSSSSSSSWMEWLGFSSSSSSTASKPAVERPASFAVPPAQRGEIGVSRPPGASAAGIDTSRSSDEQDSLLANDANAARVAERQPLFSCVADSINTAASSFSTALHTQTLTEDEEGNIHGVDASSLLAMPQVGRKSNN